MDMKSLLKEMINQLIKEELESLVLPGDKHIFDNEEELDEEVSKKGAQNQLKSLNRKTFKGKVSQVKKKMPGIKNPEAFVASRIKKATGKSPRKGD